jgi:hypothetical protein
MPRPNIVLEPGHVFLYKALGKTNETIKVSAEDAKKANFIKLFDVHGRTFAAFSIKGTLYAQPYRHG